MQSGVVVSASHNPWFDNGIKLFSPQGSKLSDADQAAVEARLIELDATAATFESPAIDESPGDLLSRLTSIQGEVGDWVRVVCGSIDVDLRGSMLSWTVPMGQPAMLLRPL